MFTQGCRGHATKECVIGSSMRVRVFSARIDCCVSYGRGNAIFSQSVSNVTEDGTCSINIKSRN